MQFIKESKNSQKNVKREANNSRFQGLSSEGGYTYLPSSSLKTA